MGKGSGPFLLEGAREVTGAFFINWRYAHPTKITIIIIHAATPWDTEGHADAVTDHFCANHHELLVLIIYKILIII